MNDELEVQVLDRERTLVLPHTGELVDLRDSVQVARALEAVREGKRMLDELRQVFETVLRAEAMTQGTKTLHLGDYTATVSGGEATVYDAELLREGLEDAGCPETRIAKAVKEIVTYKVDQRVVRELAAANPVYARAAEVARSKEPLAWRVSVKRERKADG